MAANFNKVLLMGNLTRDPQLSYLPSQTAVVDFALAVNRRWTGRDGQDKDETCFVDCRAFGQQAENINKYLSKGRLVFVEGRLTFNSWTAADGTRRSKHRVTVERLQFLPGAPGANVSDVDQTDYSQDKTDSKIQQESGSENRESGSENDDIPF
jgi:single-strand DNA-binding protein